MSSRAASLTLFFLPTLFGERPARPPVGKESVGQTGLCMGHAVMKLVRALSLCEIWRWAHQLNGEQTAWLPPLVVKFFFIWGNWKERKYCFR